MSSAYRNIRWRMEMRMYAEDMRLLSFRCSGNVLLSRHRTKFRIIYILFASVCAPLQLLTRIRTCMSECVRLTHTRESFFRIGYDHTSSAVDVVIAIQKNEKRINIVQRIY